VVPVGLIRVLRRIKALLARGGDDDEEEEEGQPGKALIMTSSSRWDCLLLKLARGITVFLLVCLKGGAEREMYYSVMMCYPLLVCRCGHDDR